MVVDLSSSIANPPVAPDQTTTVDLVQQFTYLFSVIAAYGSLFPELQARIAKASDAMGRLNRHLISRNTMLGIFNALVGSVIPYGIGNLFSHNHSSQDRRRVPDEKS